MSEPIPRRRRHPHHVCIDCGVEWDGITAAPVAGEGLDPYRNANEHERQSMAGTHNFDPHCPFCFLAHFDAETRAELAANQPVAEERT